MAEVVGGRWTPVKPSRSREQAGEDGAAHRRRVVGIDRFEDHVGSHDRSNAGLRGGGGEGGGARSTPAAAIACGRRGRVRGGCLADVSPWPGEMLAAGQRRRPDCMPSIRATPMSMTSFGVRPNERSAITGLGGDSCRRRAPGARSMFDIGGREARWRAGGQYHAPARCRPVAPKGAPSKGTAVNGAPKRTTRRRLSWVGADQERTGLGEPLEGRRRGWPPAPRFS